MNERGRRTQAAVLHALKQRVGPASAYELLSQLRRTNPTLSAPTIYRALSALTERGEIHRLQTINAFIARKIEDQPAVLSICDGCGGVEENAAPGLLAELRSVVGQSGFSVLRRVIEIHGHCAACAGEEPRR